MTRQRVGSHRLDVETLPPDVSAAIEAAIAGQSITLLRSGLPIGVLEFCSNVLHGTIVDSPKQPGSTASTPEGVCVVATAMRLSDGARRRLSDEFGDDYIVLDMREAPASTDVLLTHPVSPQLLRILQQRFPKARILITEIEDPELGVRYMGPVSRLLDAGAAAYLPPRRIAELAASVRAYLQDGPPMLEPRTQGSNALPASPARQIDPG